MYDEISGSTQTGQGQAGEGQSSGGDSKTQHEEVNLTSIVDSSILLDTQGQPVLKKDGTPKRKPGRKPGQTAKNPPAENQTLKKQEKLDKESVVLSSEATAAMILGTFVGIAKETIGPEWEFNDQEEADAMKKAVSAYIQSKGGAEMSPDTALFLVSVGYAVPRFTHENTRQKLSRFFGRFFQKIKSVFGK